MAARLFVEHGLTFVAANKSALVGLGFDPPHVGHAGSAPQDREQDVPDGGSGDQAVSALSFGQFLDIRSPAER